MCAFGKLCQLRENRRRLRSFSHYMGARCICRSCPMPSSLGYSAPVLYGALVKAPPIFQRTELSLKFVWLFLFFCGFSHFRVFPDLVSQSWLLCVGIRFPPGFRSIEVIPLKAHGRPHCCEGPKRRQVSFADQSLSRSCAGKTRMLVYPWTRLSCGHPVSLGNVKQRCDGVDVPLGSEFCAQDAWCNSCLL